MHTMLTTGLELADRNVPKLLDQIWLLGEQARQLLQREVLIEERTCATCVHVHLFRLDIKLIGNERGSPPEAAPRVAVQRPPTTAFPRPGAMPDREFR